jgi:hypothetical protein
MVRSRGLRIGVILWRRRQEHSHQTNRYLHFLGTSLVIIFSLSDPLLLLTVPVALCKYDAICSSVCLDRA